MGKLDARINIRTTKSRKREMIELAFGKGMSLSQYVNAIFKRHCDRKKK